MQIPLKTCTRCKQPKPLSDFYTDRRASDGAQSRCKPCFLIGGKASRARHAEKRRPRNRERLRRWRTGNPEAALEMAQAYRDANPGKYAEIQRRYRTSHNGRAVALLNGARKRAKDKGLGCSLTREWVEQRVATGRCELTGLPFDMSSTTINRRRPFSPSIDRVDNAAGYTADNCRVVISAINVALNEWGDELFTKVATAYLDKLRTASLS